MDTLYYEKIKILREVLALTENVTFTGNESDADVYIELVNKRDELFDKAKALDARIAEDGVRLPGSVKAEITSLARSIIERDNYMKETVAKLLDGLKTGVKNVNTGKSLSNIYIGASDSGGSAYDWSK